MKARRLFFRAPTIFGNPLKYGAPVFMGFTVVISGLSEVRGGDILRGGSTMSRPQPRSTATVDTPDATEAARANARDTLARTTRTLDAMRAMQNAARNAALANSTNHLGNNPNHLSVTLPVVPNGLGVGALNPTTDPTKWVGAKAPEQITANGKTSVKIEQTTQQALLEWQTLNVGKQTTLTFDQKTNGGENASQWIAFNKITDPSGNPTQILGDIKADGQVYLINQNGIIFGGSSQVNVRNLTASSLSINDNLIQRGLLNNPDTQFLFSGMNLTGKVGDVTIQAGAKITSTVSDDGNGGRVFFVGANVTNSGTISTPSGQTILAAGLEVGIAAHASDDPSIRGLDVYVGAVKNPVSTFAPYAGTATNLGLIESARGNVTISGKDVYQSGVIESSTSVALNGSVRLLANYGATRNAGFRSDTPTTGTLFNFDSSGTVILGNNSLTRILPEYASKDKVPGAQLALRSQIEVQGKSIYMGTAAEIFAPSALVTLKAGVWTTLPNPPFSTFLRNDGQVYLDTGAKINLAGTTDATASVLQNYLTVTLRGSELAVAPLQRDGVLRGDTIVVDITQTGTYNGKKWVGTPLADVSGYLNLIERDVSQLTTAGGTLDMSAGGAVVVRDGADIDVSGGWTKFTGDTVQTTRLSSGGRLIDVADATPDLVYDGIFTGSSTVTTAKWGVSEIFAHSIAPTGQRYRGEFVQGADAGKLLITSPAVALDGSFLGKALIGPYQSRSGATSSNLPTSGAFSLKLEGQVLFNSSIVLSYTPTAPTVVFGTGNQQDVQDFDANTSTLSADRTGNIHLSETLLSDRGFANLTLVNEGGDIVLPQNITLRPESGSTLSLTAANIDVLGRIISPGSSLSFKALNLTSFEQALIIDSSPGPSAGRGVINIGASAVISTAGILTDDRTPRLGTLDPFMLAGGNVNISAYTANLRTGGKIDVSGGYILTSAGSGTYGNGGSISISAGIDPGLHPIIGGSLTLGSELTGYSGKVGGSLNIQTPHIQIGGTSAGSDGLLLNSDFFSQGGFGTFKLSGLGLGSRPGVLVEASAKITPVVKSYEAVLDPPGSGVLSLRVIEKIPSERTPISLTLASPTVSDADLAISEPGEVILKSGSEIRTEPGGSVTLSGSAVSVRGSIIAQGGTVSIRGGSTAGLDLGLTNPLVTTEIGAEAYISTAGTVVYSPDAFGRRIGRVLAGGKINLAGNISAATGAILDVSGTSAILDLDPDTVTPTGSLSGPLGIIGGPPAGIASVPVRVDSDAGTISLQGNELLYSDATLLANRGGTTALGGTLFVSSGLYNPTGAPQPSSTLKLQVTQKGSAVSGGIGSVAGSGGNFAVDSFSAGGFDSLTLDGVVGFNGDVTIAARRQLNVSSGVYLQARGNVKLSAPHVILGGSQQVVLPGGETSPFFDSALPTFGTGTLVVNADLIDLGNLSLQQIGSTRLIANQGDIRGSGTVQAAGDITLRAGQIFPNTASKLSIIAYDRVVGGVTRQGQITVEASGTRSLPLSAGGTLSLYASNISQSGTLRAPFGTINLGWDGTGTRPVDILAGSAGASAFPQTKNLVLGAASSTSVSAVDPATGKALTIPYGISTNGENWIDPRGVDITTSGEPEKNIFLLGSNVTTEKGSSIDLRGGGELYAYRWVQGLGGLTDILASSTSFAIIPGYASSYAPVSEYNTTASTTTAPNLIAGNTGYTNSSLNVGDRIYLAGSASLPAGYYTLLPARYALISGAVLVTPTGGSGSGTVEMPDASSLVSGYRYNSLDANRAVPTISTRFEVASAKVVRARAEYQDFLANTFLKSAAQNAGATVPRLPIDSGRLVFQSTLGLSLSGQVSSASISGGRGAAIDISTPLNTVITAGNLSGTPGSIYLDSNTLNSFGAESLLIGGRRNTSSAGISIQVGSGTITVDNAGSTLSAQDLILVAKDGIRLEDGASLSSSGKLSDSDDLLLSGNGTLVRISADNNASILRSEISQATSPLLSIGANAKLKGGSIILDSSSGISLAADSSIDASSYQFNAGNIALLLDNPGMVTAAGLVVSNALLAKLQTASSLKLLSYGSIDLYGSGTFGSTTGLANLSLSSGQIRGMNNSGGIARIAAKNILLENSASSASLLANGATAGRLEIVAESIGLGANQLAINGYSSVLLESSRGIIGEGTGGLSIQGNLDVRTPVFAGAAGAKRTLTATGSVALEGLVNNGVPLLSSGLGSSLSITGSSVNVDNSVSLPSGSLKLRAVSGNLEIKGMLDVSGTEQRFHDVKKITSAGNISLSADAGNVILASGSKLDLSTPAGGGDGGSLSISTPAGTFSSAGTILGSGGVGGKNGSFSLDVLSLASLSALNSSLAASKLTDVQKIRIRTGDVLLDGTATARDFELTADRGNILVTGTVDASGKTGGEIHLAARGDLTLNNSSRLTVAGQDFSSAGKGGSITLESGTQLNGVTGTGSVDIQTGSVMDLSVASKVTGSAVTEGSSAYLGKYSGKLHIRAPRNTANNDLLVKAFDGTIIDASSILVEGYRLYDLTSSGGTISSTIQTTIRNEGNAFIGAAASTTANYTAITNRLLSKNSGLASVLVLAPGAEIINRTGDLTLGTSTSTTTSDWNLSTFRFGAKSAPGVLTLRAAGDLVFFNALSDGFNPTLANTNTSWLWTARLAAQNNLLPVNEQTWSYRLSAGADLSAAGFGSVLSLARLVADKGSLKLGKNATNLSTATGTSATTASAIANRFQVIRTGSGDIDINAGRDVQLLNQFATIYTAGTRLTDFTLGGLFKLPSIINVDSTTLGVSQQSYSVQYSMAGGNVNIHAAENIGRFTLSNGVLVADSQLQMPTNWLYRRGYLNAATGRFGQDFTESSASTTWWVDFSNFFQGVGALGGGDVNLSAGNNISNVDAVIPTNARMPGYTDATQTTNASPDASKLLELGGGSLSVTAGNNIDAGVYYIERGKGELRAGGSILTNATRSVLNRTQTFTSSYTQLPTTLFLGKGAFDISANGDILLGPVANPFLLPGGQLNGYNNKSYFSTFDENSYLNASSLGGDITFRESAAAEGLVDRPILQLWFDSKLVLTTRSASANKPWLRLNETDVNQFSTLFALQPGSIGATSFSGDINLVGDLLLSPASKGNLGLYARGSLNALQPNGILNLNGSTVTTWGTSRINLSDADPARVPGTVNPFGFQSVIAGTGTSAEDTGPTGFLDPINLLFAESGGTLGTNIVLQTKQTLHASGPLHVDDLEPLRLYAADGDISGLQLFSSKFARVIAGDDISDIAFYIQNTRRSDTSIVSAGRDLLPYTTSNSLRQAATTGRNQLVSSEPTEFLDGDIQISGPGTLEVLAGRNLDLGIGSNNADGTGSGITSIGNSRNPYLPDQGANLVVGAGLGLALGLADSSLHLTEFIDAYVNTQTGAKYLKEIAPGTVFADLSKEEQARLAIEVFYLILRDAGQAYTKTGNKSAYEPATAAIELLFGKDASKRKGDILARSRDIRTSNGGGISIITPGGGLVLANSTTGSTLAPPGIVTASGGNIGIFANNDINIGIGRIFTLRGGNEIIWSSKGDIAAGSSSKTVLTASPTRVRIDPQSASVQTDLSGLATGGGIGVLSTIKGVKPGNVDLIAPEGTVNAGDAGIRVSGNLNIAANQVLNAGNISVGGVSAGTLSPVSVSANIGGLTTAANSAAATTAAATEGSQKPNAGPGTAEVTASLSIITVEVIGYGGSSDDTEEEEKEKNP